MANQIYWDDVEENQELPVLVKDPTTQQLVRYAGASGDFYQIHYDKDFAINTGLPGVIIHGALKNAFLGQLMTDWIGESGTLRKLSVQYREMDMPGEQITCTGKVLRKYSENGEHLVDCEIQIMNSKGERTTPGRATVALPTRSS